MEALLEGNSQPLKDQEERDLFRNDLEGNYSVIAPAGVGKTTAIVGRIANIASTDSLRECPILPRLIVVTFTRKAAQEMLERARVQMLNTSGDYRVLKHLDQTFFGTIHSFCLNFIKRYGPLRGVASDLEIISSTDDTALWDHFLMKLDWEALLPQEAALLPCFIDIGSVITVAKTFTDHGSGCCLEVFPGLHLEELFEFKPNKRNQAAVGEEQKRAQVWLEEVERGSYVGIPECKKGGAEFKELWQKTFESLQNWASKALLYLVQEVAKRYLSYRVDCKRIFYDDLVHIAKSLMEDPYIRDQVRREQWCVLLDEAQDTDKDQFDFLLDVAGLEKETLRPGAFSMVGDPQQSIYSSRSSVYDYLKIHELLAGSGALKELTLSVTMRCPSFVVETVNDIFPKLWGARAKETKAGVRFVPLNAKPEAVMGSIEVSTLEVQEGICPEVYEARLIAKELRKRGPHFWNVERWGEVALLAPRRRWLLDLAKAFQVEGLPYQIHSHDNSYAENPVFAWMTALVIIMEDPFNSFEIVGVLREIFGISDHDIAVFVNEHYEDARSGHPVQIFECPDKEGLVHECLHKLSIVRQEIKAFPLRDLIQKMADSLQMVERFKALPPEVLTEHAYHWSAFLDIVIEVESQGGHLHALGKTLKHLLQTSLPEEALDASAIQLFTYHKAKGLEWPVVILPFLNRKVSFMPPRYPYIYRKGDTVRLLLSSCHKQAQDWSYIDAEEKSEFERLLYVALTRAKRHLVFVDDRALYEGSKGKTIASSLGLVDMRSLAKSALSEVTCAVQEVTQAMSEHMRPWTLSMLDGARDASRDILTKQTPSKLSEHTFVLGEGASDEELCYLGGKAYGNWWHTTMQYFPWGGDEGEVNKYLLSSIRETINPGRGELELTQFQKTAIYQKLRLNAQNVYTEVPLAWEDGGHFYEGVVDCLVLDPDGCLTLIDWKTDIITGEDIDLLRGRYQKQLAAYVRGLSQMGEFNINYGIYSTCYACWIELN